MRSLRRLCATSCVLALLLLPTATDAALLRSFDQRFEGDDPTEGFDFTLPYDAAVPSVVRFEGFAENLNVGPEAGTGVRFALVWRPPQGGGDNFRFPPEEEPGVRLPAADPATGPLRVPIQFETTLPYSPALLHFTVEGLGPADNFQFVGDLSIRPVPEPAAIALPAALAALAGSLLRRNRRPAAPV